MVSLTNRLLLASCLLSVCSPLLACDLPEERMRDYE